MLETEKKEKREKEISPLLTILQIELKNKKEEEPMTFKDAVCLKYNIKSTTDSKKVFERYVKEFYKALDKDEFVVPNTEKRKGITVHKTNGPLIRNNEAKSLTQEEAKYRIIGHKDESVLEGIICGGFYGRPRNARQLKNKNLKKEVTKEDVITDNYYMYLYMPMDYHIGYLLLQYYPEITIKSELIKFLERTLKPKRASYSIETTYYCDDEMKENFSNESILDHLIFKDTFINGDTINEEDGIENKEIGGVRLKLEVSSLEDEPIQYPQIKDFLKRMSNIFLNQKQTRDFKEKRITLKNRNTGKTTTYDIDGDLKLRPAILLCECITVDDTGIPDFIELKKFCTNKMEEIKEKTLPGYEKKVQDI